MILSWKRSRVPTKLETDMFPKIVNNCCLWHKLWRAKPIEKYMSRPLHDCLLEACYRVWGETLSISLIHGPSSRLLYFARRSFLSCRDPGRHGIICWGITKPQPQRESGSSLVESWTWCRMLSSKVQAYQILFMSSSAITKLSFIDLWKDILLNLVGSFL